MKKQPKHLKSSDGKHTPGIRGGHPVAKHSTLKAKSLKRKVTKGKSLSSKKTKIRKRDRQGNMQNTGIVREWKPFMK